MHTTQIKGLPGRSRAPLRPSRATHQRRFTGWLVNILGVLLVWQARASERHRLAELEPHQLEPHQLEDMGLTRADVTGECSKPFWRA